MNSNLTSQSRMAIAGLLLIQGIWLAWSATWQSPTLNEPGQIAAGIAHWTFGQFEPASVNPPAIRLIAAIPAILEECAVDWSGLQTAPGARCEAQLGMDWVAANGFSAQSFIVQGRWMLIPISLAGGGLCFVWGWCLFGERAGLLAMALWCFEPLILGHGQLITNDIPATVAGLAVMLAFWRWLSGQGWQSALWTGLALGAAFATKFTWVVLLPVLPGLGLIFWKRALKRRRAMQLAGETGIIAIAALLLLNSTYAWRKVAVPLGDISFVSRVLREPASDGPGNRFRGTWLTALPVPVAADFLKGLDLQWRDFEVSTSDSYLCGTWRREGWWYYYAVGLLLKCTLGTLVLGSAGLLLLASRRQTPDACGLFCLTIPALVVFGVVSLQTSFNHHIRYVLPCLGPWFVLSGSVVASGTWRAGLLGGLGVLAVCGSSWNAAPASLAYFHELAGGISRGPQYLLHSNVDWGQDLIAFREWLLRRPDRDPVFLAYYGYFDPIDFGLDVQIAPYGPVKSHDPKTSGWQPGWYAISVNYLYGCDWGLANRHAYQRFRDLRPVHSCGASIRIYQIPDPLEAPSPVTALEDVRGTTDKPIRPTISPIFQESGHLGTTP